MFVNVPISTNPTFTSGGFSGGKGHGGGAGRADVLYQPSEPSQSQLQPSVIIDSGPQLTPSTVAPPTQDFKPDNQVDTSGPDLGSSIFQSAQQVAKQTALENSQLSQEFAREQMRFQEAQNAKAMQFSAEQAELNREFQRQMSNTAHQREVEDLLRAGLNPVLSALGGASTPSGSAASGVTSSGAAGTVDTTANQLLSSVLNALIGQETAISVAEVNKQAAIQSANVNARVQRETNAATLENQRYLAHNYPQTEAGVAMRFLNDLLDLFTGGSISSGKKLFSSR